MPAKNNERWLEQFDLFKEYVVENGRFPSSANSFHKGIDISQWYRNQLTAYKGGFLPSDRLAMLDAFNPVWKGTLEERKAENKRLLLSSYGWKKNLSEGEIPIDNALSGDELYACLSRGIFSCKDYLTKCEDYLDKTGFSYYHETRKGSGSTNLDNLFNLNNRREVFHAQFPKLEFLLFCLYIDTFGRNNHDLFKQDELDALGRDPTYFEAATALNAYSQYPSREEFARAHLEAARILSPCENDVIVCKYHEGKSRRVIAEELGLTEKRVHQAERFGPRKFYQYLAAHKCWVKHPRDILEEQQKSETRTERAPELEDHPNAKIRLDELDLSVRTYNCLSRARLYTLQDVASLTLEELNNVRNLGPRCANEIIQVLEDHDLTLRPSIERVQNGLLISNVKETPVAAPKKYLSLDEQIAAANSKRNPPGGGGPGGMDGPGGGTPGGVGSATKEPSKKEKKSQVHIF